MMCTRRSTARTAPSLGSAIWVLSLSARCRALRMCSHGIMKLKTFPRAAVVPRGPCMLSFIRCP
eukprot:4657805-Karenia_brevis.AAC.1